MPNFVDRYRKPKSYPVINNDDGSVSTHRMAWGSAGDKYVVFPTIIQRNGAAKLEQLESKEAFEYAMQNKEYLTFDTAKEAEEYATGGYKSEWGAEDGSTLENFYYKKEQY